MPTQRGAVYFEPSLNSEALALAIWPCKSEGLRWHCVTSSYLEFKEVFMMITGLWSFPHSGFRS